MGGSGFDHVVASLSESLRKVYPDRSVDRMDMTITSGMSRGVRRGQAPEPPIYSDPPKAPWEARIRDWHLEQRNKDPKQRHPFFRWLGDVS